MSLITLRKVNDLKVKPYFKGGVRKKIKGAELLGTYLAHRICIIGQSGYGKTVLAFNIIDLIKGKETDIYIFSPTGTDDPNILNWIQRQKDESHLNLFNSTQEKEGRNVINLLTLPFENKDIPWEYPMTQKKDIIVPRVIILIDDLPDEHRNFTNIAKLYKTVRHKSSVVISVIHDTKDIQKNIRQEITICCMFRGIPWERFHDFIMDWGFCSTETEIQRLFKIYETIIGPKEFLFMNKINGEMRKNLSEIIS